MRRPTASFTTSSSDSALAGGANKVYQTVYDVGTVSLTVGGTTVTVPYQQGGSAAGIALALSNALDASGPGRWPTQARFWLEWGSSQGLESMLALMNLVMLLSALPQGPALPGAVQNCLEHNSQVAMIVPQKPPYLKVFFTQGSGPDYAIVVRERGSELNRVLVCMHSGDQIILGSRWPGTQQ